MIALFKGKKGIKIATIMLLAMMVVIAGCSSGNKANESSPSGSPAATGAETPNASESAPQEEPVELTISTPPFEKSFPAGFQDDPVMKEIEKRLNIKLNIIPANAVGDVNAKFAAQLASGDLPDISWVPTGDMYAKIISAKAALPLDEYVDQYAPHIKAEAPARIEYPKQLMSTDTNGNKDGKLYFLATGGDSQTDPLEVQVAPYLRYDLWEKLGFPKLETMDDYLPVLKQMMELEPTNADGKKNYGVSGWFGDGWGDWPFNTVFGMFEGKSLAGNGSWGVYDMATNQITPYLTDPDSYFWKSITWFNKAYRMGVLDPDAFTMKWDNYLEKTNANRIFLGFAPWTIDGGRQTFINNGETDKGYFQMPAPNNLNEYIVSYAVPQGTYWFFVNKNTKHPEKAVELLDFLISYEGTRLIANGVEGVHWDVVDGKPQYKQEVLDGLKNDADYKIKSGVFKYHNLARGWDVIDPKFDIPIYYMYQSEYVKERLSDVQKKGAEHFGVELPGDLFADKAHKYFDTSFSATWPAYPEDIKDEFDKIEAQVVNYVKTNQFKIVAVKSEEKFEAEKAKFIADVKNLGMDKLLEWNKTELAKQQ